MADSVDALSRKNLKRPGFADVDRIVLHAVVSEEAMVVLAAPDRNHVIALAVEMHGNVGAEVARGAEYDYTFHINL